MKTLHYKNQCSQTFLWSLIVVLVGLICGADSLSAQKRSTEVATKFALNYFNSSSQKGKMQKAPVSPTEIQLQYQSGDKAQLPVYIFQNQQKGFVVFAQSTNGFQILGYSDNANFDPTDIPESLQQLLKLYENANPDSITGIQNMKETTVAVAPLLDAAGVGLNQFHHEEAGGSWSGCVATAMTQIMCYYKYPQKGRGSHCYTNSAYGQLCVDFENTNYNWLNPTEEDYKLLSFHVGVSMDMNYNGSPLGSSPLSTRYLYALQDYFGYTCEPFNNFSRDSRVIQDIIALRKPIYVELPGNPGHAVVLDGYDSNGFFHVNFGWGGSSNGYYLLNNNSLIYSGMNKFGTNLFNTLLIQPGHIPLNKTDSLALVSVKNNISNLNWDLSDSQKRTGVTTLNGRVMSLDIYSANSIGNEGSIPEDIENLKELIHLNISGKLHGTIPQSISNLSKLQTLRISNFSGTLSDTIPYNIGNLTNLTNLSIYNAAKGPIPSSIGKLVNLRSLYLPTGNINGTMPEEIFNLKNLQEITLDDQKLSGNISENLGKLKEMIYLSVSGNQLSGNIPTSIGELTKLTYLNLSGNNFTGQVPLSLKNCSLITNLKLENNNLEGEFSPIFENMKNLKGMDLSNNKLSGIPENIGKLTSLQYLNLDNNLLTSLPDSLNQLRTLQTLSASSNKISRLPENMNQLTSLNTLNLANNEITTFHQDLCLLPNLASINLSYNKITNLPAITSYLSAPILEIQENELTGKLPPELLKTDPGYYRFNNNRFVYNDIPSGTDFTNGVGSQKPLKLSKQIFKANLGDSIIIDIRKLNNNLNKNDKYVWCEYPRIKKEYQTQIEVEQGPVLHLLLSDKNISKKYYCKITNDSSATYKYENYYIIPCLPSLITDTVSLDTLSKEEFVKEKYPDSYIIGSQSLLKKEISDKTITLISPFKMRGVKKWEASSNKNDWFELSTSMAQNDLKANVISVKEEELKISPKTPAYYRCALYEPNCAIRYSDTLKINPYGMLICDTTLNVKNKTVTIKRDSIEVTIPQGINDGDFRLTIVKLDNPPEKPDSVYRLSSVYDVTVSFGDSFYLPVIVKFKNLNKKLINQLNIENYKAVYFDDVKQQWTYFNDASISLKDSTLTLGTFHFTKLGYFEFNDMNYTHIFTRGRVNVIYRYGNNINESNYIDRYNKLTQSQGLQSWHKTNIDPEKDGNPYLIQDISEYMNQIINKCDELGLETPSLRFNVYVTLIDNYGQIGSVSYLSGRGFFYIDPMYMSNDQIMDENRKMLMTTLAHEYTHYTQDYYMSMLINNYFWQEAVAPIGGRMIWNIVELPETEPEMLLREALSPSNDNKTIFEVLATSWYNDYNLPVVSKLASNSADYNLASLFLHYMQNYRIPRLQADYLLMETPYNVTWLGYLEDFIARHLHSTTGSEFADYVKYLFTGENTEFNVLNTTEGNPLKYVIKNMADGGNFATYTNYNFTKDEYREDKITLEIPYLAAKLHLLNNVTADKAVIVKYKRLKEFESGERVYYGKYNVLTKQMNLVEITDSVQYVFLLEARTEKSSSDYLNSGFLLFVNGNGSGTFFSSKFKPNFQLTAQPVPNIRDLCYADVTQDAIHNYSNGSKNIFFISGKVNMSISDINFSTENYQTSMELIEDSIIQVNCSFTNKIRVNNGPNLPATIQNTDITQKIEYDFITGNTMIHQFSKTVNKWGAYHDEFTDTDKPEYTFEIEEKDQKMWLKKILNLVPDNKSWSGSTLLFETKNTEETMKTVDKLEESTTTIQYDESGKETSRNTVNYLNTDYTTNNTMRIWFHNK